MAGLGVGPNGIRSKLFAGVSNASGAMGHLGSTSVHQAIPIPVTSRGIGFATCAFARALAGYRGFDSPTVHSLYRAFLGIFEAKMRQTKLKFPAVNTQYPHCQEFHHSPEWIAVLNTATVLPEPLYSIICNVGVLKFGDDIYLPVMSKDWTDAHGLFVPAPHTVTLSNLRRTVTSLSSGATPRAVRDEFLNLNPIPGCRWNGRLLANPDEIIPANYGSDDLFSDIAAMTNLLPFVEKHLPKMVGGLVDYDSPGTNALLLSNDSMDLRCPPMTGAVGDYVKGLTSRNSKHGINEETRSKLQVAVSQK
ncbi:Uncharacterized protein OBRU01_16414 [Operophtera brumata]|uniref:Uncharacterized protein n=1 Tax=Operophtera brumata TaxID=104452 RepID=A0A0L7L0G1_OPEBR|nr:Uncharacterized protein OBRU01_16414 [Operophtera brumata]